MISISAVIGNYFWHEKHWQNGSPEAALEVLHPFCNYPKLCLIEIPPILVFSFLCTAWHLSLCAEICRKSKCVTEGLKSVLKAALSLQLETAWHSWNWENHRERCQNSMWDQKVRFELWLMVSGAEINTLTIMILWFLLHFSEQVSRSFWTFTRLVHSGTMSMFKQ